MKTLILTSITLATVFLLSISLNVDAFALEFNDPPIQVQSPIPMTNEQFGYFMDVDGNDVLIGARPTTGVSSVYLYDLEGQHNRTFINPESNVDDLFGITASVSGDNVLVGAPNYDNSSGRAYLFDKNTGDLLHIFENPTLQSNDKFGYSVSVDGNHIVIGAFGNSSFNTKSGAVYLYDATSFLPIHTFSNPSLDNFSLFGTTVLVQGNDLLVSSPSENPNGTVYLFDIVSKNMTHSYPRPMLSGSSPFGFSISMTDTKVLIGSEYIQINGTRGGAAYLFDKTTEELLYIFENPATVGTGLFGSQVSIDGDHVLIGDYEGDTISTAAGIAYLYNATTGNLEHTFSNPTSGGTKFGLDLQIADDVVLIGAVRDATTATGAGAVYIFKLDGVIPPTTLITIPPATPILTSPANEKLFNNTDDLQSLIFNWQDNISINQIKYTIQISLDTSFDSELYEETNISESNYEHTLPLADGTYYWRVQTIDTEENISSEYSEIFSFTVYTADILPPEGFPPTAILKIISPLDDIYTDDTVFFSATDSSDPDEDLLFYEWDFGDGNKSGKTEVNTVTRKYSGTGSYTTSVTVTDSKGNTDSDSMTFSVKSVLNTDSDNDGIADHLDACPLMPENYNGFEDMDGCPDIKPESSLGYLISVMPKNIQTSSGSEISAIVNVTRNTSGISQDMNLSCSVSNPEITCAILPDIITSESLANLSISIPDSMDDGVYEITVTGTITTATSDEKTASDTLLLIVSGNSLSTSSSFLVTERQQYTIDPAKNSIPVKIHGKISDSDEKIIVTLVITRPDGTSDTIKTSTQTDGFFGIEYDIDEWATMQGSYTIDAKYLDDILDSTSFDVMKRDKQFSPISSFTKSHESIKVGMEVYFDASESSDPDGKITKYGWNFGDGINSTGKTTSHIYKTDDTFTVTLVITDNDRLQGSIQDTITVAKLTPEPTCGPGTEIVNGFCQVTKPEIDFLKVVIIVFIIIGILVAGFLLVQYVRKDKPFTPLPGTVKPF